MRRCFTYATAVAVITFVLGGCSTQTKLLRLERDNLVTIRDSQRIVRDSSLQSAFDPARYDLYLFLNVSVFNGLLEQFDNFKLEVDAGRPIEVTLKRVRFEFRPGYPSITIAAEAKDPRTGIVAELEMAAAAVLEPDANDPKRLLMRLVVTDVVPNLKWGPFELKKWALARRLAQVEAMQYSRRLPRIEVPLERDFTVGGPAGQQTVNVPTGDGSMTGVVTWPATLTSGSVAIKQVLFLPNGVHVFANVEGL